MSTKTTLEQWQALQAVVKQGSYAQAAVALHKSQSSISYAIHKLEQQLGVDLLVLQGRKAVLTDAGKILVQRSNHLVTEVERIEALAQSLQAGQEAEIRLVVDAAFPLSHLMQALKLFAQYCPETRIQMKEVVLSGADDALLDGQADIAIGGVVPQGVLGDYLMDVTFVAVSHPEHPLQQVNHLLESEDLKKHTQVVISDSGTRQKRNTGWLGSPQRWTVSSISNAVTAVENGLGFGWLPEHAIEKALQQGQLKALPLAQGRMRKATLYLMRPEASILGPATNQLIAFLKKQVSCDTNHA